MSHDEPNGAALLDEQSSGSRPSPNPSRNPFANLFYSGSQPTEDELPTSPPAGEQDPSQSPHVDVSDSAGEWPTDPEPSPEETGPPASSGDGGGPLQPLGKAALKATTRKGVLIATSAVHRFAARTELERRAQLYVADEQDQELIGDPVANLLHRRGGIVGGQMSPDANDALSALMGLANYVGKQVALQVEINRLQAGGGLPEHDNEVA
jgi:hypothetical protein